MINQTVNDNRPIPEIKILDEFQEKFLRLPIFAQDWMCSVEAAENNAQIAEKFRLPSDKNSILAKVTGDVILKDFALDALPSFLQENFRVSPEQARQIALEIATRQLLIIKDHLKNIEGFIVKLGGAIPQILPTLPAAPSGFVAKTSQAAPTPQKPFRQAVAENKEILNQLLTTDPIKIPDLEQPVRPTIKNWLSDYIKQRGTGHHEELERSEFLFKSENAKNLSSIDRSKLARVLKAYDEDIEVPISPATNLILIDALAQKEPTTVSSSENFTPPAQIKQQPAPTIAPTPPIQPFVPPQSASPDTYREQIDKEDLAEPVKLTPKTQPRIEGNVVDLKNYNNLLK